MGDIDWFENVENNKYLLPRHNMKDFSFQNMFDHYAKKNESCICSKIISQRDIVDNLNHGNDSIHSSANVIKITIKYEVFI